MRNKKILSLLLFSSLMLVSTITVNADEGNGIASESNNLTNKGINNEVKQRLDALKEDDGYLDSYLNGVSDREKEKYKQKIEEDRTNNINNLQVNNYPEINTFSSRSVVKSGINDYINQKKFPNPTVTKDSRMSVLPKNKYKEGKPIGVVVHETANSSSTIYNEVNYMYNNWGSAFVHAYANKDTVIETADTNYLAWGAGAYANPYFIHIELCRHVGDKDAFARSVNNDAYWIASKLKQYGLKPSLADNNRGDGTVISHNAVSNYWGGTNHTDPTGYFNAFGYDMNQFFSLIEQKYNELNGVTTVVSDAKITANNFEVKANKTDLSDTELVKLGKVTAEDGNGKKLTPKVKSKTINRKKEGTYKVVYSVTGENKKEITKEVSVKVVSNSPLITGDSSHTYKIGEKPNIEKDFNIKIEDDVDGLMKVDYSRIDVDTSSANLKGNFKISVTNSNGKEASKDFTYKVEGENTSESKPEETNPSETVTSESKPEETRPSETESSGSKPEETRPSETVTSESNPEETRPSETQPSETESSKDVLLGSFDKENTSNGKEVKYNDTVKEKIEDLTEEDKKKATPIKERKNLPRTGSKLDGDMLLVISSITIIGSICYIKLKRL